MIIAPMPFAPFLELLRESARRLHSHLIVILVAREADCPWLFTQIDRHWSSLHDLTGNDVIFLTVDGGEHIPVVAGHNGFSLRSDMGKLHGACGLVAFSTSCRLLNELEDKGLDGWQTEGFNTIFTDEFIARRTSPRARRGEWADKHSLGMSSVISALEGVTERMLPCLRLELLQTDYSLTLPLSRTSPENAPPFYDVLRQLVIAAAPLFPEIAAFGEALRRQGAIPRKAAKLAVSIQWLLDWNVAQSDLPPDIREFVAGALKGRGEPADVYRAISPLRGRIDPAAFSVLRAHLNRLIATKEALPLASIILDRTGVAVRCAEMCRQFDFIARDLFRHYAPEGGVMDPLSMLTLISSGLKLVDQFRELAIRFKGQNPVPPSGKAEQVGTALEVRHGVRVSQRIEASQLRMDQWDAVRYAALDKRIRTQWGIYNDLFAEEAGAAIQERARVRSDMRNIQAELCRDFKEMVQLYERALGTNLPDHYQLYEVCQ